MILSEYLKEAAKKAISESSQAQIWQLEKNIYAMRMSEVQERKAVFELFGIVTISGEEFAIGALAVSLYDVPV